MNEVADEIISEAEKKAAEIIKGGNEEAEKILDDATNKISGKKDMMKKESEEFVSGLRIRELTKARMRMKKDAAEAKGRIINSVYENFFEEMAGNREKLLRSLSNTISGAKAVYVNEKDYETAKRIFSIPVKKSDIDGGIMLESTDGFIDISLPIIKGLVRDGTVKHISAILFGVDKRDKKD